MRRCWILLFLLVALVGFAQHDSDNGEVVKVHLEYAKELIFDEKRMPDAQILVGNVSFRHDSSYMYCDSAYYYQEANSFEAFSNVRMEQGDTLFVYGDYLHYDANISLAKLRRNVRMENQQVTLYTDSLNYDRVENVGYYFDSGVIIDEENELYSVYGQYSPDTKLASFSEEVLLDNKDFQLTSDTLLYNTDSKIATILGESVILSDSATIYSTKGIYDSLEKECFLLERSLLVSNDRFLTGDSIYYDEEANFGEAFGSMSISDTTQLITMQGEYGYYDEMNKYAFVTDSALLMEYAQKDTLFMHADSMMMTTIDSTRLMKAYYGVRFYRKDMQGVCDSLEYNTTDTVLLMYDEPILWNENYQITGDTIAIFLNDSTIDMAHIHPYAFSIQQIDSSAFNQLKGQDLKAHFNDGVIERVDIEGNAESIFFPIDEEKGEMIGMNQTKSGFLSIWIKDNTLDKLKIWPSPTGKLTPIPDLSSEQKKLPDFTWFDYLRPLNSDDIFREVEKKTESIKRPNNRFKY